MLSTHLKVTRIPHKRLSKYCTTSNKKAKAQNKCIWLFGTARWSTKKGARMCFVEYLSIFFSVRLGPLCKYICFWRFKLHAPHCTSHCLPVVNSCQQQSGAYLFLSFKWYRVNVKNGFFVPLFVNFVSTRHDFYLLPMSTRFDRAVFQTYRFGNEKWTAFDKRGRRNIITFTTISHFITARHK